jgi:hypothetical protein
MFCLPVQAPDPKIDGEIAMRRIVAAALVAFSTACAPKPDPQVPAPPAPATPTPSVPTDAPPSAQPTPSVAPELEPQAAALDFGRDVQPILARRCQPCHQPGGQMYGRMPFDDAATVASHPEGILRRLKGDDRALVERWIADQPGAR